MLLSCIGISQYVPLAMLYWVSGSLGFYVALRLLCYQLRHIKGLFVALNNRSVYTRRMLRYTALGYARLAGVTGSVYALDSPVFICTLPGQT